MIGTQAEYAALVCSVVPMSYEHAVSKLPLVVGLQLRNIALSEGGVRILPPGRKAFQKAEEILGDQAEGWLKSAS